MGLLLSPTPLVQRHEGVIRQFVDVGAHLATLEEKRTSGEEGRRREGSARMGRRRWRRRSRG